MTHAVIMCRFFLASSHDLIDKQGFQAHLNQEQMNKASYSSLPCCHHPVLAVSASSVARLLVHVL
jgi:hypothetical protein